MSIIETLKSDHRRFEALLESILTSKNRARRDKAFRQLKLELTAHSRAEEKVLYRRMEKSAAGRDQALEANVEHEVADRLVADLARGRNRSADAWTARCVVLQELLDHHIEEEEEEVFPIAEKLFDETELERMQAEFLAEKARHGMPAPKRPTTMRDKGRAPVAKAVARLWQKATMLVD